MNTTQPMAQKSRTSAMIWGNLLALSTAICWGLNEPANKAIIPDWISASGVALGRIFGATILIWILSLFFKKEKIQRGDWKLLWASALMMLGFVYVFSLAFNTASPIDIALILTFQPILVVIINAIFKHEHVSVLEVVGMVVALGGAVIVILGGGNFDSGRLIGDFFAVVCAVTYAIYLVIIEGPSHRYGAISLMKWVFLFTSILALPLIFTVPADLPIFTHGKAMPWLLLGFIILFPTVYCYMVTPPAIRLVGSEVLAFYQYLVPVITTVVAIAVKMDSFHWYQPVSFLIIVAGVILVNYAKSKSEKKS
ncbi:MAG: DMT family transporter [Muribaculaceae bacterium]|nr:DMT family transporter [Muribaculaceae bacterium]